MKTKSKSTQVFELRLWSREYYAGKPTEIDSNIYGGFITDFKSKKKIHFHTAGQLMAAIEKLYKKAEKKK